MKYKKDAEQQKTERYVFDLSRLIPHIKTLLGLDARVDTLESATTALDDLTDVDTDKSKTPADNDVLTFDGTDWNAETLSTGISDVIDDTTPQLGGDLDVNSNDITGDFGTGWTSWTPTLGVAGGTYTSTTVNRAVYFKIANLVFFELDVTGTAGSTPTYYTFTLPTTPATGSTVSITVQRLTDTSSNYEAGLAFYVEPASNCRVYKYDRTTWTDGAGSQFKVTGWYLE